MRCRICGLQAKTEHGLRKHMTGSSKYGGHDLLEGQANSIIAGTAVEAVLSGPPGTPVRKKPVRARCPPPPPAAAVRTERHTRRTAPTGEFVADLFASMAFNKALPKYQFERRVDAILALFLPDLLAVAKGWMVDVVAPEFPIKRPGNNQTTNADYAIYRHATEGTPAAWILLELKTDASSIRDSQLAIYKQAKARGMASLRRDLDAVIAATLHTEKYLALISRVDAYPKDAPIEVLYLLPRSAVRGLTSNGVHVLTFSELKDVDLPNYPEAWAAFKKYLLPVLE